MAAQTGKTSIPLEPGSRKVGARVMAHPEASSATYPAGCLVIKSAGYIQMHTTGYVSVSLYGVANRSGRNATANGDKKARFYRFENDKPFKGVLSGTYSSTYGGNTAALSQNTAGAVVLVTATSASDSSVVRIVDVDRASGFTDGDVNPVVLFVPLSAKIQEG